MYPRKLVLPFLLLFAASFTFPGASVSILDIDVLDEIGVSDAWSDFGVSGEGVIIAVLDRGIDYEHPDFRNDDGSTRIHSILDLTDDTGANDSDNSAGVGTVYTRDEINAALTSGSRLAHRDAVGHGTTTAGLAGGNGRGNNGEIQGVAPNASFIIVKFTTEGAPAHNGEPAEAAFFDPTLFPVALDFVLEKADDLQLPLVALGNFGSVGPIPDGTTDFARAIDERFGPGKPGRAYVTGPSDDGGADNHAAGQINQGETVDLMVNKDVAGNLRLRFWYHGDDKFDAEIVTPTGTFGPYASPASDNERITQQTSEFWFYHNGKNVDFAAATSNSREILIDITGPTGEYVLRLTGASVADGNFHAWLNPSRHGFWENNKFENFVVPGYTVYGGAAAFNNITPNSYVLRHHWNDVDGIQRSVTDQGAIGDLWVGSGIGPTTDGRYGITVSAPGERLFAPYAPRSYFATFRFNLVADYGNGGLYGIQSAVSAANPTVTGVVALMLEADPTLDASEIITILQETARQDAFTGEVPNNEWGYGKIDAHAAVAAALGSGVNTEGETPEAVTIAVENFPNPFVRQTTIRFQLPDVAPVRLTVYDLLGREMAVLVDGTMANGSHDVRFNASDLPSGVYIYQLEVDDVVQTHLMTRLR